MSKKFRQGFIDAKGILLQGLPGNGLIVEGTTVPTDGTTGYAAGCLFFKRSGTVGAQLYFNEGSSSSCDFNVIALGTLDLSTLLATAAEINRATDLSTRIVNVTASTLSLTLVDHSDKIVTINAAAGCAITLPAATGTGARFRLFIGTTVTSNTTTITRAGSDTMFGMIYQLADGGATLAAYECPGSTVITLDGSTKGGIKGDCFTLEDVASATWSIIGHTSATGSEATPVT